MIDWMMAKMASGSDASPQDNLDAINKLEQKLRSKDTPDSERQTLMTEYQEKAMAFRSAQVEALKDPEVQKAQEALRDATVTAMQQQDPQTKQLMEQLQPRLIIPTHVNLDTIKLALLQWDGYYTDSATQKVCESDFDKDDTKIILMGDVVEPYRKYVDLSPWEDR